MFVGVPKEIKDHEYRVGLIPHAVHALVTSGHSVLVEQGAGLGSGITDEEYISSGATIVSSASEIFTRSDLVVKVKEPLSQERALLRSGQILFTYLHLAPDRPQTEELQRSGAICIAYETVTGPQGGLPLLMPMSEIAGRLAPQVGAHALESASGGRGILLGGVPGVPPAHVVILGGGVSGTHAATIAVGMGAQTSIVDFSHDVLRRLMVQFGGRVNTIFSTLVMINKLLLSADLVICTVLRPGAAAPKLITRAMLSQMKPGSVIVDVSIDQGGCCETSRPTTHSAPTYTVDQVIHYCVANMPGAVARTSTFALNNATLPFVLALANKGWKNALREDPHLRKGLNICEGQITCEPVALAHHLPFTSAESFLT